MSTHKKLMTVCAAVVLAFGLAACGSSDDDTAMDEPTTTEPMPDPAIAERAGINSAITAASTAVTGLTDDASDAAIGAADSAVAAAKTAIADAANVPAAEKAAFNTAIAAIEGSLGAKKTSIMAVRDDAYKAMRAAMAKTGKAMHAALGPNQGGTTPLTNIAAPTLGSTGLTVNAAAGAGSLPDATDSDDVLLKAGDAATPLGSWNGTHYAHTDTGTKVVNEAVVYNNKGPGRSVSFATLEYEIITADGPNKGYVAVDGAAAAEVARVMATAFTHSGTQNHPIPARSNAFYVSGTYDGASGEYRCTGTCTSTNDGKGAPSGLGGTWHFKPDAGASAMAHQPDTNYLYYGWWVSKDKDGAPTAASAFAGIMGDVDGDGTTTSSGTDLTGSATYAGHAAGKFAMSNPLDATGNGGHFTADATLSATFGGGNTAGMTGTIDNFMVNDEHEMPWSVALHRAGWGAGGAITASTATAGDDIANGTTWSIDGNSASESGTWSGQMYDELPGNAPTGDGSDIPTTVTGTFYSEFSTIGRMVGAFGADKQ